ncbi:glycosyltransferase [Clostridium intestinale]|uniref:glycosyltransferase n=1 Tax=Clostridium intestinale TaxID=36845 RepID=UPI0004129B40|nr:glycosyltransferase [Clostridium intestinale]
MNKVIFFIGTLSNGGAERVVSNLSLHMAKNINKKILLFGSSCKVEYPYEGDLVFLDKINEKNIFYKAYALFKRIREIKLLKRKNPKVPVISFLEYPNLINALTRKYGKTILSVRNHMSTKHSKGVKACFWGFTIKHLYSKADLIIAVSQEIKRDLIDNYGLDEKKIK